jgi:hypothetical protein
MKRRQFFKLVGGVAAVGVAGALVHDPTDVYTDPYDAFLARVRTQLISLTREHGREVHLMRIDPPRELWQQVDNSATMRRVTEDWIGKCGVLGPTHYKRAPLWSTF